MVRTMLLPHSLPMQACQLESSSSSSSRITSPGSIVIVGKEDAIAQEAEMKPDRSSNIVSSSPLSKFLGNEPNQMVILSGTSLKDLFSLLLHMFLLLGPFLSEDQQSNIIIARPIPAGYTLIAKPMIGAPPVDAHHPLLLCHQDLRQVDASNFSFSTVATKTENNEEVVSNSNHGPLVMMWTSEHPEGKLVPLRQPEPPVYFQHSHC